MRGATLGVYLECEVSLVEIGTLNGEGIFSILPEKLMVRLPALITNGSTPRRPGINQLRGLT
jgi:hypothetical protein